MMPLTDEEFELLVSMESDPYSQAEARIAWRHAKTMDAIGAKSREWMNRLGLIHAEEILGQEIEI